MFSVVVVGGGMIGSSAAKWVAELSKGREGSEMYSAESACTTGVVLGLHKTIGTCSIGLVGSSRQCVRGLKNVAESVLSKSLSHLLYFPPNYGVQSP